MRKCLLLLGALMALAGPASAQYVFLDVNGDGLNSNTDSGLPDDVLNSGVTSVDVYYITNENRDGSTAACQQGPEPYSIFSYSFVLSSSGTGTVTYGTWTDNLSFTTNLTGCNPYCQSGPDAWIGRGGSLPGETPGKHRAGTLGITVTGTPVLTVAAGSAEVSLVNAFTSFGSECFGSGFTNTIFLGQDFLDADGTEGGTPVLPATWGQIKTIYR